MFLLSRNLMVMSLRVNTGDRYLQPGLCQQILDADPSDTFINQQDYVLNLQGKTYSSDTVDRAPRKLFQWVDESKLRKLPTFSALVGMFLLAPYT